MPPKSRLSREHWIEAALDALGEGGVAAVAVEPLAARLGVTKGSFYWHFADVDAFLGALAERWAAESERTPGPLTVEDPADAESVLVSAMEQFADRRVRNLTRAMREWAQTDARARAALHTADEALFGRIKDAFASLGFSSLEAEVRGKILYYSGVGFAHVGPLGERPAPMGQLGATWDILARRP
jgi:AcrR family transcriptional regulator